MQTYITTTPFGRRSMTLGQLARQASTKSKIKNASANKWKVFQDIREARDLLGASDRSLTILNALLSFHRDTELSEEGGLIVWPSNEQLMARANGMSATTLRRHLAVLVESGLIIRRDSPNGKRFARKGRGGEIEQAYGFDLSPIISRAAEFKKLADSVQVEKKALRVAKEQLTLLRRDIVKMIELGVEEAVPGNWERVRQTYRSILDRLPRSALRQTIEGVCEELKELWAETHQALETFIESQNMDANAGQSERHIQDSYTDSNIKSETPFEKEQEASGHTATDNIRCLPKRELPLTTILDACPNMSWLVKDGKKLIRWPEFVAAADVARRILNISPSAWSDACTTMGEQQAAAVIAGIYQRCDQINNAGGYLRNLTEKAKLGKFSVVPMIMALLRVNSDRSGSIGVGTESKQVGLEATPNEVWPEQDLEISGALHRSMEKLGRRC